MGVCYSRLKKYTKAINAYTKALNLDKNDVSAYYNRGRNYTRMTNYEKAIEDFTKAIELEKFDEVKRNKLLYRSVKGMSSSPADNVANLQFQFLRDKADAGQSFVVVGRCSETILREYEGMVSFFIMGEMDKKVERVMKLYNKTEKQAADFIKEKDKKRKKYHDSHCKTKWGDSKNYDLSLNSSKLGIDESVNLLSDYIDAVMKENLS